MPQITAPLHPRPRLTREHWVDLNGPWGFAYDDADVGLDQRWQDDPQRFNRSITVPFPPESQASGIGDTGFHPVVWYRRTFEARASGGRLVLHFGAVDYRAQVWVNGDLVATHQGGNTPFSADITASIRTAFEAAYKALFARTPPGAAIQFVALRLSVAAPMPGAGGKLELPRHASETALKGSASASRSPTSCASPITSTRSASR